MQTIQSDMKAKSHLYLVLDSPSDLIFEYQEINQISNYWYLPSLRNELFHNEGLLF